MKDLDKILELPRQVKSANPRIPPTVGRAGWAKRHTVVVASFLLGFLLPAVVVTGYMFGVARDQYVSEVSFVVRDDETAQMGLLAGFGLTSAGNATTDAKMLYEYLRSPNFVADVDRDIDLRAMFLRASGDPIFALKSDATQEDLIAYWRKMVTISVDSATGMIGIEARAFDPRDAQTITLAIHDAAGRLVNNVSDSARDNTVRYAERDLAKTVTRLHDARVAMARFRDSNRLMDPQAAVNINSTVIAGLSQELTEAMVALETLRAHGTADVKLIQAQTRVDVLNRRIEEEQQRYVGQDRDGVSFSTVIDEYTKLALDLELAEKAYSLALAGVEAARSKAEQDTRYLATFVEPTLPQTATRPRRMMISALAVIFIFIGWLSFVLIGSSNRDRF
ncbi:hypothetical protein ACEUZ9_002518 [Paracoccus litorisediminis]|uniref:Capsular polysaccharide transport system permease protein n=1 Tax=Paracoccus litorisediminis TaxID=2006130 RepID=A0A844HKQ0_9RHOB|nr:hypothetical protein [Paracoccus litorisediminis]MTH60500.1 hypothetical protein [Paracoccus litorisediminis]